MTSTTRLPPDVFSKILEDAIRKNLARILSTTILGSSSVVGFLTYAITKYITDPLLAESYEAIIWQVNKYESRQRLEDVNESSTTSEFDDTFLNL